MGVCLIITYGVLGYIDYVLSGIFVLVYAVYIIVVLINEQEQQGVESLTEKGGALYLDAKGLDPPDEDEQENLLQREEKQLKEEIFQVSDADDRSP